MSEQLSAKQYVPVTEIERQVLRDAAAARNIGAGLLARVLYTYGLEHIDDLEVGRRIDTEKAASKTRISEGARVANQARWGSNHEGEK